MPILPEYASGLVGQSEIVVQEENKQQRPSKRFTITITILPWSLP